MFDYNDFFNFGIIPVSYYYCYDDVLIINLKNDCYVNNLMNLTFLV